MSAWWPFILLYSSLYGVDPHLVRAVIKVESQERPQVVGLAGEIGLMQILPSTAKLPRHELFKPYVNIEAGVKLLAQLKQLCPHKTGHSYVICYNKGIVGGAKIKYPLRDSYYRKVMDAYNTSELVAGD
jgi:soluble lytic murein transglycosylase-like protein